MAEIKTLPIEMCDKHGNKEYTFTENHTLADVVRWLLTQGDGEEIMYLLKEEINENVYRCTR